MNRVIAVICAFAAAGLALLADTIEGSSMSMLGSMLWMIAMIVSTTVLYAQAKRTGVTQAICVAALIPYLGLVFAPIGTVILALKPTAPKKLR